MGFIGVFTGCSISICSISNYNTYSKKAFKKAIGFIESNNNYSAVNKNSSAIGKYQFLWNHWQPIFSEWKGFNIDKETFLNRSDLQEELMDLYIHKEVDRYIYLLDKYNTKHLSINQMRGLVHFKGFFGTKKYLKCEKDVSKSNNMDIEKYLSLIH